jgi:peptide chain release factor 1
MIEKLAAIEEKYEKINNQLSQADVISDQELYKKLMKEHKELSPVVNKYRELLSIKDREEQAKSILAAEEDREMREMAQEEINLCRSELSVCEEELRVLLLPKDANDDKNVMIEIRGGVGGEEAALFAAELYRMYSMYAEVKGYKVEVLNINETELGGIKEISFLIEGEGAYSRFKFESGTHRVQRVPDTESSGRIHTSAVTVAVLPVVEDVEIDINPADLQIDTYRSGGAGGQHVNKTESAIRITHIPSGVVVECQDERSQHKNRDKAMKVLRAKLFEAKRQEQSDAIAKERKSQVGSGDRSERIRTYNFPQGRLSDHRIGLTLYRLEEILNGDLDEIIDSLTAADRAERLKAEIS